MEWLNENFVSLISVLFGTGGICAAIITRVLDRRKYNQEVRKDTAEADIKGDEFWKQRYDVLQKEVDNKDTWWKERYDALYKEYENVYHDWDWAEICDKIKSLPHKYDDDYADNKFCRDLALEVLDLLEERFKNSKRKEENA